ncbi:MAG: VCBS repeat-containing protein [Acidobacteriota bacterium]
MFCRILFASFIVFISLTVAVDARTADFDGNGKADIGFYRPSNGTWYTQPADGGSMTAIRWGISTDVPVPGDYDGDGRTDRAVWRPETGTWHIQVSSNDSILSTVWGMTTMHFTGGVPDVPVAADYDGDGADDIAVWRPDTGQWFILNSSDGFKPGSAANHTWGRFGDIPVPADYDGDGKADIGIFRPWENTWYIIKSSTNEWIKQPFGQAGEDRLVPADYDGDGKADIAVYRHGTWFTLNSRSGKMETFVFGFSDDTPVPADYDGDGETDRAIYRKGVWYIAETAGPRLRSINFGRGPDVPIASMDTRPSIVALP